MSQLEVASNSSPLFSADYTLSVGQFTNIAAIPNYLGECSKIVGCVRTTAILPTTASVVVTKDAVIATVGPPAVAGFPTIRLSSTDAGDVNSYRIYWTNEVVKSQIATVLGC